MMSIRKNRVPAILVLLLILVSSSLSSQEISSQSKSSLGIQFGGQMIAGIHYELNLLEKESLILKSTLGYGINEYEDDTSPHDRPIIAIPFGFNLLNKIGRIYIENSILPSFYQYRSTTFVNLNIWTGLRYYSNKSNGFFLSIGYVPILYSSYTDPFNSYQDIQIGIKLGETF